MVDAKDPPTNVSDCQNRVGATARSNFLFCFLDLPENCCPPARLKKLIALAFMKATPTNPILSALHPQGPKSNIYVHFH